MSSKSSEERERYIEVLRLRIQLAKLELKRLGVNQKGEQ